MHWLIHFLVARRLVSGVGSARTSGWYEGSRVSGSVAPLGTVGTDEGRSGWPHRTGRKDYSSPIY
jgi:hypothetical protein